MKTKITSTYPTRYAAFSENGVLFEAEIKKESGGYEWAVYDHRGRDLYGEIISCRGDGLTVNIVHNGRAKDVPHRHYIRYWPYSEFEIAKTTLINELKKYYPSYSMEVSSD
jgi:hypothetical protein